MERRPAATLRQRVVPAAATVSVVVLMMGWSGFALTVLEDPAAHAEAQAEYREALAQYEGAKAVELQDAPATDDPLEALEQLMTPETQAGHAAAAEVAAAKARVEATEPTGLVELWPL